MNRPVPDSAVSVGIRWAHRITSVGLEFALPPFVGSFLDRRWGTGSLLTIIGAILGLLIGMVHLLTFTREISNQHSVSPGKSKRADAESERSRPTFDESNESERADHG